MLNMTTIHSVEIVPRTWLSAVGTASLVMAKRLSQWPSAAPRSKVGVVGQRYTSRHLLWMDVTGGRRPYHSDHVEPGVAEGARLGGRRLVFPAGHRLDGGRRGGQPRPAHRAGAA